jgi:hypothetical protein
MRASTRLSARLGDERVGFVDFATDLTSGGTLSRLAGWGELDTLWVDEAHRRRGIGTWRSATPPTGCVSATPTASSPTACRTNRTSSPS